MTKFQADNKVEILEYLAEQKFPIEIINLFMSKL
jgi:hypothetical protein